MKKLLVAFMVWGLIGSHALFAETENIPMSLGLPPGSEQNGEGMHYWPDGRFEVFIAFDVDYSDDVPDWQGIWKVSVEARYSDFITLNGETLTNIMHNYPPANGRFTVSIHNDIVNHGLRFYCIEGLSEGLDKDKENTIVFDKNFPLMDGKTLGKSYKFVYDPKSKIWTGSVVAN